MSVVLRMEKLGEEMSATLRTKTAETVQFAQVVVHLALLHVRGREETQLLRGPRLQGRAGVLDEQSERAEE